MNRFQQCLSKQPIRIRYVMMSIPILELSAVLCTVQAFVLFRPLNNGSFHTEFLHISRTKHPFWMYPINSLTMQISVSQKSTQGNRIGGAPFMQGETLDLNRCTCIRKLTGWRQSSYIALSCKISLLSRQRTTKALIRLRGCAGWSASLLFTYDKNRLSHDVAHIKNRSYLCRIRRKRICCIQFYGKKQQLLIYHSGIIFAEDLMKTNLLWLRLCVWGTVSCDCLCSGQKVF